MIVLPAVAYLAGSVSDDGLPAGLLTANWSQVSGPGTTTFANPGSTNTTAAFSAPGDYVLRLSASDSALTGHADLPVLVRTPAMNQAPVVSAGANLVIGLTNVAALAGTVADDGLPVGAPVTASWSQVSGPGVATFDNPGATNARATFRATGSYVLRLAATDTQLSASSDVTITVYPHNQPPVVIAGPSQTVVVPDPDALMANGILPTNPAVELSLSLLSAPHWNNAIGQPGLGGANTYASIIYDHGLSWSGTRLYASGGINSYFVGQGGFHVSGTNYIGDVAVWDGANWSGLYDPDPIYPGGPPYGYVTGDGDELGYITARGDEVFVTGGFVAARQPGPRFPAWACSSRTR